MLLVAVVTIVTSSYLPKAERHKRKNLIQIKKGGARPLGVQTQGDCFYIYLFKIKTGTAVRQVAFAKQG